jgi:hypothetical protein
MYFKYLGSWISFTLTDDKDIEMRIAAFIKSVGGLKVFFDRKEVRLQSKFMVFMALPINFLLWGCESWAVCKHHLNKLQSAINLQIRRILKLTMWDVKEQRITNEQLWERFCKIPTIQTMIDIRALQYLGKVIRGQVSAPPRHVLIAYVNHRRPRGRPSKCNKECLRDSLDRLLSKVNGIHVDRFASLKDWYRDALDDIFWKGCINHLKNPAKYTIPRRPNPNASYNPRSSARQRNRESPHQEAPPSNSSPPRNTRSHPSPPRNTRTNEKVPSPRSRDHEEPTGAGTSLLGSLKVFDLGVEATFSQVKASRNKLARTYHPDKHRSEVTGLTPEGAKQYMQVINRAFEFLQEYFERG